MPYTLENSKAESATLSWVRDIVRDWKEMIGSKTNMQMSLRLNGGTVKNHNDVYDGYARMVKTTDAAHILGSLAIGLL